MNIISGLLEQVGEERGREEKSFLSQFDSP
jgi:hypothetical protein